MGCTYGRPANYRPLCAKTNGENSARNSLRKICPRIHSRDEHRPAPLQEIAPRCRQSSHRARRAAALQADDQTPELIPGETCSLIPEKVFEAQAVETRFCFFTAQAPRGREFFVNRCRRLPLCRVFQETRRVEAGFVKPEQLVWPIRSRFAIDHSIKRGERRCAVCFFFQAYAFFEKSLVPPLNLIVRRCRQLVVNFDGLPIIFPIAATHLEKKIALPTKRFHLLIRSRITFQHLFVQQKRILGLASFPFDA